MKTLSIILLFTINTLYASETFTAKIILLKGKALVTNNGHEGNLKLNDLLSEKATIKTLNQSVVRVKLVDESTITLAPNSEITLDKLDNNKPSLLQLISGKVRAQVKKKPDREYGLFIKTPTASLGVRGTDFEVIFNDQNKITSALTFSGEVKLSINKETHFFDTPKKTYDFDSAYEEVFREELENEKSKSVKSGEFSGAFPGYSEALVPIQISKKQFEALKNNQDLKGNTQVANYDEVKNAQAGNEKKLTNDVLIPRPKEYYTKENYPTEVLALPGGYLDQKTGIYVSPPADATYNEKDNTYNVPDEFGEIDKDTGDYIPPLGLILHPLKGFIFLGDQFNKLTEKSKELVTKLNGNLKKGMTKLKELTRLDSSLLPALYYDNNIVSEFYGRIDRVTRRPSYVLQFDGFLAHKTWDSKNWLIYPKGSLKTIYHYNQEEKIVNQEDTIDWTGGIELNHRYLISHRPGRQIFEINYHITMRDQEGSDQYNFDTEDIYAIFGQEFKLHSRHTTKIWGQFTYYETFQNKLGTIWSGHFTHFVDMGRKHDLRFGSSVSRERPNNLRTIFIWDGFISHIRKNLWEHYNFASTMRMRYTDLHLIIPERGEEKLFSPELRLTRILDDYLKISAFINYERNASKQNQSYDYERLITGADLNIIF